MEQNGTVWNNMEQFGTLQEGERMTGSENTITTQITQEQTALTPDAIYQNKIYELVDDVKQEPRFANKSDEELKQDKSFFPSLVNYIYNNYIGDLLDNKHCKPQKYEDIKLLDYLFNIYVDLVFNYKWNNRPLIIEFSLFTGIARDTIYNWSNGLDNNIKSGRTSEATTRLKSDTVRKWIATCERALIDGNDTIKDIFILKAKHGYRDNNNDITITVNHKPLVSADDLPTLTDLMSNN